MKYHVVVNAGRNWESSFSQEYRRIAERRVYLEASSPEQAAELAKAVLQAVYPEANAFEAYNVVDERTGAELGLRLRRRLIRNSGSRRSKPDCHVEFSGLQARRMGSTRRFKQAMSGMEIHLTRGIALLQLKLGSSRFHVLDEY